MHKSSCSVSKWLVIVAVTMVWMPLAAGAGESNGTSEAVIGKRLPAWSQGELDIYFFNTGRGNSSFLIFPDGTTMLLDAGDMDDRAFERREYPLQVVPPKPAAGVTAGKVIATLIEKILGAARPRIDYAMISHFHTDHYGEVRPGLPESKYGRYVLTGLTEVGEYVPIGMLLDRDYPDYNSPTDLAGYHGATFSNYLAFQRAQALHRHMRIERLRAGAANQIVLEHDPAGYPGFRVRVVKSGEYLWTGRGIRAKRLFDPHVMLDPKGKFTENPLSAAIRITYGNFRYFAGGDNTGSTDPGVPGWFDVETPMGRVVGPVDVMTLDHHGNRDATNADFLRDLRPRVIVQQAWCSDQPGGEVLHRLVSRALWRGPRDIFATSITTATQVALGPWLTRNYQSLQGHILVRVNRGGASYRVFVIDDGDFDLRVKAVFGPYASRSARN